MFDAVYKMAEFVLETEKKPVTRINVVLAVDTYKTTYYQYFSTSCPIEYCQGKAFEDMVDFIKTL